MVPPEAPPRRGSLRRSLVWGAAIVGFATLAPLGSAAVALAGLLWASRPRAFAEVAATGLASGIGLWWLLQPGALPDQFLRAAMVIATATFVVLSMRTGASFTHRALSAAAAAAVGCAVMLPLLGSSWSELRWWVEFQQGTAYRDLIGLLSSAAGSGIVGGTSPADIEQIGARMEATARLMGQFAAGIVVVQILAALTFATAVYRRIAAAPVGRMPSRFRELRFSEHLGWAAVLSLVVVVLPKVASMKLVAANILLVAGVLYALRGAAVVFFGLQILGVGGPLFWTFTIVVGLLMLPVVVGSAILLGVVDAGVNLRRRWTAAAGR